MDRERWATQVTLFPFGSWWTMGADTARPWFKCWWFGPIVIERFVKPTQETRRGDGAGH